MILVVDNVMILLVVLEILTSIIILTFLVYFVNNLYDL